MLTELAADAVARLDAAFAEAARPDRAPAMAAYLRNRYAFLGIAAPERVVACRAAWADLPAPEPDDVEALVRALWARDAREHQYAALWFLQRHEHRLPSTFLPVARDLITTKSWWDTVDPLAVHVVGDLVRADRRLAAVMDRWIDDDDIWLARTAILHQNAWKTDTDADRLFRYCLRRAGDTEFFIRKAIGWALRERSKVDADGVRRFVADHADELSGLSRREAVRWLDRRAARTEGRRLASA